MNQEVIGIGTPEVWDLLSSELKGQRTLEKPRVSKKTMIKAIRWQTSAMQTMSKEFNYISTALEQIQKELQSSNQLNELLQRRIATLEKKSTETDARVEVLQESVAVHKKKLARIQMIETATNENKMEVRKLQESDANRDQAQKDFMEINASTTAKIQENHEELLNTINSLEHRMNNEQTEILISSAQVIVEDSMTLKQKLDCISNDNLAREKDLKESESRLLSQSNNIQNLMMEARRTMEHNTVKVEQVQRDLLDKADCTKVDDIIESKYEEIIVHLQTALSSINEDEDEFKRVSQELQEVVQNLSSSKADKKDLLEVKEQILHDSRIRQQVENLRTFIDLKMNRDEVLSEMEEKADKNEVEATFKQLSESIRAITSTQAPNQHRSPNGQGPLPRLEKDKCLTCDSLLPGSAINKNPHPLGQNNSGFRLNFSQYQRATQLQSLPLTKAISSDSSGSVLLGIDGNIYHGDIVVSHSPTKGKIPPIPNELRN